MATSHDPTAVRNALHGQDLGAELLPLVGESPAEYLVRLKALHARVGTLIETIESRRPALGGPAERPTRAAADRRADEAADRREGLDERRIGLPEARPLPIERREGARERRVLPVDRRDEYIERRRDPRFRLDGTALMWALQIAAWIAVAGFALLYGLGRGG